MRLFSSVVTVGGMTGISCQDLLIFDHVTSLHLPPARPLARSDLSAEPGVSSWPPTEARMLNKPASR